MKPQKILLSAVAIATLVLSARNATTATWNQILLQHGTEYYGHLAEWGSSDSFTETAWTYARYYGPPEQLTKGETRGRPPGAGWQTYDGPYSVASRTYISTGRLFDKDEDVFAESWVATDRLTDSSGPICDGLGSWCVYCKAYIKFD